MVDTKGKNVEEHTRVDEGPTKNIIVEDEEDHDSDSEGETDKQPIKKRNRREGKKRNFLPCLSMINENKRRD